MNGRILICVYDNRAEGNTFTLFSDSSSVPSSKVSSATCTEESGEFICTRSSLNFYVL